MNSVFNLDSRGGGRVCRGYTMKGSGDVVSSGVQGQSPGRGSGGVFFWKYTVKNAHFVTITLQLNNQATNT